MKTSLGERILRKLVTSRYKNKRVFFNFRPETLLNPKTGRRLEIDIYFPDIRLAYEFQGARHSGYYQTFKDEIKVSWAEKNKVKLNCVWAKDLTGLMSFFTRIGVRFDDDFKALVLAYSKKSKKINSRLAIKSKGNKHAKEKARFYLKLPEIKRVQEEERAFLMQKMARRAMLKNQ